MNLQQALAESPAPVYNTASFSWDKETLTMGCEISTLTRNRVAYGALYIDRTQDGIILESHRTGQRTMWRLGDVQKDIEGDIQAWTFIPTYETILAMPEMAYVRLTMFND